MSKIKILQVNKLYFPWIGGVEKVVQEISEGLREKAEVSVLVCQPKGKGSEEVYNEIPVTRAGSLGMLRSMPISFSFINKFRKLSKNADIIQFHFPFPLGDLACLLSHYKGKVVIWWHCDIIKQKNIMFLYKHIMKRFLKRADLILTAAKENIECSKHLKEFKDKCRVIPFGIDIKKYEESPKVSILTEMLNSKKNMKVLFVGRLVYYKGLDILIDAFANTRNAELFIVGVGRLDKSLREKVESLEMSDKVHFIGRLSDDELKSAFSDCDFFVLPSVANTEAFGLVQLEAMVYGKPVINTALYTGVPSVSLDGVTGLTVKPGDVCELRSAIQRLVDDKELRKRLGEGAFNRVRECYDIEKMIEDIYVEYERLLEK